MTPSRARPHSTNTSSKRLKEMSSEDDMDRNGGRADTGQMYVTGDDTKREHLRIKSNEKKKTSAE